MGSSVERARGRKKMEHYFEGEKRRKNICLCFQAEGKDVVGKGILKIKKERGG